MASMSSAEASGALPAAGEHELLQEQQREILRQRLADRQRELEARRQKLRQLQNEQNAALGLSGDFQGSAAIAGEVGKNVSSLMNEVMNSLQNLPKPATGAPGDKADAAGTPAGTACAVAPLVGKKHRSTTRNRGERDSGSVAFKVQRPQNVDPTIKAKTVESFDKSVQADIVVEEEKEEPPVAAASDAPGETKATADGVATAEQGKKGAATAAASTEAEPQTEPQTDEEAKPLPKTVSEEERKRIMQSPEFEKFFERTTKVVERLLGQEELQGNPFVDYSGAQTNTDALGEKLQRVAAYAVPRLTADRPVLDVRSSPHFPDVFLTSYGAAEFGAEVDQAQGCVLLWSLAMRERPEYTFTCQSHVCCAIFDCFQPSVIIGGTYAGSIVVWDTRAQSKPVLRTPLSSLGHAHPVYSIELVGTKNAHNLVSVDTDGRLCVWSLQMLGAPTETLDMKRGNKEVCVECIAFAENEVNSLVLGTEDGAMLKANIHGNKPGVTDAYDSHNGALTSLHFHPAAAEPGQRDYTGKPLVTFLLRFYPMS
ncbi:cytoplasmic dynein intermediate chain [Toxoplasma gondii ARI]|uniref:Cytoplasmic dynein intermediate chain n=2 Tax=Toxoplasma gondii TaxID=5811 RepID=A0A139XP45_TOXGO|nr:cytoplasmic dynein intermediate chain [Toxoplasma gondii VAND]KYF40557.1 cytoplasmic dynein intermediate chain [Toxoplasma gondii ARI]